MAINLYATTVDGRITSPTNATWATARDATSGNSVDTSASSSPYLAAVSKFGGRGADTYRVHRSFLYFYTGDITGPVSGLKLMVHGITLESGGGRAVKASNAFSGSSPVGSLVVADFDAIDGYSAGNTMSGTTTYASGFDSPGSWDKDNYNAFACSSALATDMQNDNFVKLCFVNYTYDWRNIAPSSVGTVSAGAYYADNTGTAVDPYIQYSLAGFGGDINTVSAANIGKVNTVATANISKIITV